jgi:hypothetical protein
MSGGKVCRPVRECECVFLERAKRKHCIAKYVQAYCVSVVAAAIIVREVACRFGAVPSNVGAPDAISCREQKVSIYPSWYTSMILLRYILYESGMRIHVLCG